MAQRRKFSPQERQAIEEKAGHRCSYCRSPLIAGVAMVIEHIIPLAVGGTNDAINLCLSCYRCNQFKGRKITTIDPQSGGTVSIFNPNTQCWIEDFAWTDEGLKVVGLTQSGRATVELLRMNNEWLIKARQIWRIAGIHPPLDG